MTSVTFARTTFVAALVAAFLCSTHAADLPDPDGQPADLSKPVKVFVLMGQSNMLGFGKVPELKAACTSGKYPYLVDDNGNWTIRNDVRNVFIMNNGIRNDEWLTVPSVNKKAVGVELPIGHYMGEFYDAPVLLLKSCIGNRSLGWDLLPPSVKAYDYEGKLQPGYGETPGTAGSGQKHTGKEWYAGKQWDTDISGAHQVLNNLQKHIPGAKGFEVVGFFWWQGDKDMRNPAHFNNYEKHLVHLVKDLRKEFNAPNAAFVSASLGQTSESDTKSGHGKILQAMKSLASGKYDSELGKNIGFVYSKPLSKGSSSSGHYGGNPETYVNIGEAMGQVMTEMLKKTTPATTAATNSDTTSTSSSPVSRFAIPKARKISATNLLKLDGELLGLLASLSADKALKPRPVPMSFTNAKISLTGASSDGQLTFTSSANGKEANVPLSKLKGADKAKLAILASLLAPADDDAKAIAGAYLESLGSAGQAKKYYDQIGDATLEKFNAYFE